MANPYLRFFALLRRLLLPAALLLGVAQAQAGLVLHYAFDETSGTTATDSSGSGFHGTLNNMSGTVWTTGQVGGALNFNAGDDALSVPSGALDGATSFSMAFWVQWDTGGFYLINGAGDISTNEFTFAVARYWPDGPYHARVKLRGNPGGNHGALIQDFPEAASPWHHIAITRAAGSSNTNAYVDGLLVNTLTHTYTGALSIDPNGFWLGGLQDTIGNLPTGWYHFNGRLDDFRIYDHALSASEASGLFVSGGGVLASGEGAPEPAETFAFLGLLTAFGLGFREWRSRRKAKAA